MRPVVLVHGAWHGPWCWDRVTPMLDADGVQWAAADLPSCSAADAGAGLAEDVQTVERILDELPGVEPAILVGHSRAGLVISEAGAHERVGHLVYLTAFLVEPDTNYREMVADTVLPTLDVGPNAVALPRPALGAPVFYNDCAPDDVRWAQARLRPMHMAGSPVEPRRRAWARRPTTYVVCARDGAIPAHHQRRMAEQATHVIEWDTGHSPFINRPDLVADLLLQLAAGET